MSKLPKHLEEMRDEEKLGYLDMNGLKGNAALVADVSFERGFNSAVDLLLKDLESMAKALEKGPCDTLTRIGVKCRTKSENLCYKCDALKNYRERYNER